MFFLVERVCPQASQTCCDISQAQEQLLQFQSDMRERNKSKAHDDVNNSIAYYNNWKKPQLEHINGNPQFKGHAKIT